jgi:fumarate reductase subunit D
MSTPETSLTPVENTPPRLSEAERVINTFFAPSKTFEDIRVNASWWMPFVLISLMAIVFSFTVGKKIGWDQVMQNEIAKSPARVAQMDKMPPEQRDRILTMQAKFAEYSGYASPVFVLISAVLVAGVLMMVFNFGLGAAIKFSTSMAIVMYAWLATLVSTLLAIITMFAGANPEGFNIRNPVGTNPAYFMNPAENKFLYGMASGLDVIALWVVFLMAIGFAANSKVKRGTAFVTILAMFIVVKLIGAGFAAMF